MAKKASHNGKEKTAEKESASGKRTFYVTTAIDYPNAEPHIGHAYQKIIADVFARWHRLLGKEVHFLTGVDEHGKKIQESAEKAGKKPQEFVDELAKKFKEAWKALNISYSRFIRTTDEDHEKLVKEVIKKSDKNGDVYKGKYEGWYCVGCEAYYTEKDLVDGKCPLHNREIDKLSEESYFFRLSKYKDFLLELYEKHPEFVLPNERRNEMRNRVQEGLKDLSISRTSFDWGIPYPGDSKHVIYVWFDALYNYLTGSGKDHKYWPADLHLLGKDNGWFHSVYWPAFLKSAGYPLPKTVFVHGFLTFNGQKISKSLGNAISPIALAEKYGADSIRYFVTRNFVFGEDGDFSEAALVDRHNNELGNKLGNLVLRISTLAEKYGLEKTEPLNDNGLMVKVDKHMQNYALDKALNEIFAFVDRLNEYVQNKKPWETHDKKVLWQVADGLKTVAVLLSPFIPSTCEKIAKTFHFDLTLGAIEKPLGIGKVKKGEVLFNKIELKENKEMAGTSSTGSEGKISYDEFSKVEMKVGKILDVQDHPNADKLYVLTVELGEGKPRTIVAGLRNRYTKEQLLHREAVFVTNLAPAKLRGVESDGMILAAVNGDESSVIFLTPEKSIDVGSKIR